MKKLISVALIIVIIAACTKKPEKVLNYEIKEINGIKYIINDNNPSVSRADLNIDLKKKFEIAGEDSTGVYFTKPKYFTVDKNGNIFVFDENGYSINKFNSSGEFIAELGQEGSGSGEFNYVMGMCVLKDTLFVIDTPQKKLNRFSLNGEFINSSTMPGSTSLYNRIFAAQDLLWIQRLSFKRGEDFVEWHKIIEARKSNLEKVATLDSSFADYPPKTGGELDISKAIAVSDSSLYMADKGEYDKYEISEFNKNFDLVRKITRKYRKLKFTDYEKKFFRSEYVRNFPEASPEEADDYIKNIAYKPAVKWIYTDKYGRLWIHESRNMKSADDKRTKFSIFKDGVYLNSITEDIGLNSNWLTYDVLNYGTVQFIGDYIYVLDKDNNKLIVWEY